MFLAKKAPRIYVGLYQNFLYKRFLLLLTPPHQNILLTNYLMWRWLHMGQGEQCSVLLKKLHPSTVVSAHLPNALPSQRLENLRVAHQAQVTCRGLSYEAVFFSFATVPEETFHCAKRFEVAYEEWPAEGLFEKKPTLPPLEIQNSTAPPSAPGDPIEAGVFNASNRENTLPLSGIRRWRLMMTWNQPPIMFLRSTILLLTHCLRDRHGGGMVSIDMLW